MAESCHVFSLLWKGGRFPSSLCGECHKPLSLHLPVVLGPVWMARGRAGRDPPLAGLREGLVEVGWRWEAGILLLLGGPALMDGQAACATQTTRQWLRW